MIINSITRKITLYINDEAILIMQLTEDKRIQNTEVHWTNGASYLVQMENQNYLTWNEKNSKPVYNYMYSFPDLLTKPVC